MLLLVGNREPVLDEDDPGADEHFFKIGNRVEEFLELFCCAKTHYGLDSSSVVPAAIEQHDLSSGWKMGYVSLEIPLRSFALVGRRKRRDPAYAWVETLRDPLDRSPLPRRITPFEDHDDLEFFMNDPVLKLHELPL